MVHLKRPTDKHSCKKCNSSHVDIYDLDDIRYIACLDCGYEEEINSL